MANTIKFLGFKQVTAGYFASISDSEKKGYIWFVRNVENDSTISAQIYLGTRLYGEMNQDSESEMKLENLLSTLGTFIDENGEWVGFLPEDSILNANSATTLTEALHNLVDALETEAEERKDAIKDINDIIGEAPESGKTIFETISDIEDEIQSGNTEINERLEDVEDAIDTLNGDGEGSVKKTVEDAIAAVVSGAPETFDTLKEIADWIEEHGQEAAKVFEQIVENTENIAKNEEAIESINNKLEEEDTLHMIYGDDVEEMTDEEAAVNKLKTVMENGGTVVMTSDININDALEIK